MKKIIKLRTGETIPDGAKHIESKREYDHKNAHQEWAPTKGIMGVLPIFGTETLYRHTPVATFHYYEVEIKEIKGGGNADSR